MRRVGLFGGTFDPIHVGHLDVAEAALRALAIDEVLVMPANVPPHRAPPRASGPHRFAMAALAIAGRPGLGLLDLEMLSQQPSYTSTTLDRLPSDLGDIYVILGADAFRDIRSWKGYPALLDRCHFAVISRPECSASSLRTALPELANRMVTPQTAPSAPSRPSIVLVDARPSIVLIDAPTAPVSATEIRRRVARGESIAGMVPDLVADYIQTHRLYLA
jgi:nicotinate-nucleotide adenylyltransferase